MFEVEKSQTEVLQMECKHTDEFAHRESTHYQSGKTLNGEVRKGSGEGLNFGRIHSTKPSPLLNGAPFSYRNSTPHLYDFFLLRFVIWLLRAYKYRKLRP